jgi:hypothetical protein
MTTASISIQARPTPQKLTLKYLPLEQITKPYLTTNELAHFTNMQPQSWRVKACHETYPEGLRPLRVCGNLDWPTAGAKKLLGVA